uniref:cGMP-dependent protein kinase n=1 Tax=Dunaliella tertiolecta TaxID=3047 RepID=A0A7S3QWW4_DUNTE|mmetsp:Transcript_20451/g.57023  ORF Transcript_20451/g.57023 Transcript_20451/m.57023 type:complete len:1066 (+) Transcript_20451:113-3310(+)
MGCFASKPTAVELPREQSGRVGESDVKTSPETHLADNACRAQVHHNGVHKERSLKATPNQGGQGKGEEGVSLHDVTVRGLSVSAELQTPPELKREHEHDPKEAASGAGNEGQQHDPVVVRLKTDELSSARTSASLGELNSLLHPLFGQAISPMKSKEGQSGSFAGFAVAGSGQGQADTTATSNGHAVAAAAAWHGSTAAKPPKSPVAANQQTAPLHKPPQEQPQGQQQQEQQQQQQQVPLWHATLLPPNHSLDSAHLPPSPDLSPPPTGFSDHTDLGLNCPRWSARSSKDLISRETSTRSSYESSAAVQHQGLLGVVPNTFSSTFSVDSKTSCPTPGTQGAISGRPSQSDNGGSKGVNIKRPGSPAMSRLGYATGPRASTMELPHTNPIAEHDSTANSLSCGANITFSQSFIQPGYPNRTGPLAMLHKSLEKMILQDKSIAEQVHSSMRGIVSLAKETNQLELGRDASGATCINQYVVVKSLGRGSFGKVKLCLNTMDGQMYAIKMVNRSLILKQLQKPTRNLRKRGPRCSIDSQKSNGTAVAIRQQNLMGKAGRAAASLDLPRPINPESGVGLSGKLAECVSQTSTPRPSMDDSHATAYESMMREIAVLKKLDHPHVVKLHEVIDSPSATYMMLVMEFMEQGPVQNTKSQTGFKRFSEPEAMEYFRQACLGLDYLHYNHVVHGDLKPENLLVNAEGKLKIADFGSARIISDASASSKVSCTPAFQPPEALIWGFTEDPIISDVWALGVCLFCFIFGRLPFTGSCVLDITNSITNDMVFFPSEMAISPALEDLLNRLLDKNPANRASLQEAMQHPWTTSGGANPLPGMSTLTSPPKVVEVSKDEAHLAVSQSPLVNLIRTKLKEKHCDQGSYIFREGDTANCVFMIMSGAVEIIRRLDNTAGVDANSLDDMEQSFSVDMDESFALEAGHELVPPGMDVKNGMLHVNRHKAQELKTRMRALLMGKQEDYVVEVKGPGQVFGEVSLEPDQAVQYKYSARARTSKVVVVKLTEEAMLRGLLQQLSGDGGNAEDSDAFSMMATESSFALAKSQPLQTIEDDAAADVQGW